MAKRKKKTGEEKAGVKVKEQPDKKQNKETTTSEDDRFDFGGLPDRDLKKSLGCG